jgi:hypothetical protein
MAGFDAVIANSRAQASASSQWLGSANHLILLQQELNGALSVTGWRVVWCPPGSPSYAEHKTKTIAIERLVSASTALSPDEAAEYMALSLLHEALHARFSGSSAIYTAKRAAVNPAIVAVTEHLYQRIEDARVQRLGVAADLTLSSHLEKFHDAALQQREENYCTTYSTATPWTTSPPSQRGQALLAFERRLFHPGQSLTLDPDVSCFTKCGRGVSLGSFVKGALHGTSVCFLC